MPIIINGGSRSAGAWWAKHLGDMAKNERAELIDLRGLVAETMPDAFREMHAVSLGTKCTNYFYQANINPREDEHLTPAQWREAVDTLERNLGLTGQPRFVVEHEKDGRTHRHVVWSRIDPERMTAISDSLTAAIHERTSRELEIKFDLERGRSILTRNRDFQRPERRPQKHETFRALDGGIDPKTVKAEISALWRSADNGHSFKAALEASGYVLARGDRRDFVLIDRAGDDHSLARRAGVKAAEVRERMKGIDPASLPSVAEARAQHADRQAQRDTHRQPEVDRQAEHAMRETRADNPRPEPEDMRPLGKTAGDIRTAWTLTRVTGDLIEALAARGITLAAVSADEARQSERTAAFAREVGNYARMLREGEIVAVNECGDVYRFDQRMTGDLRPEIEGRLAGVDRASLLNVTDTKEAMQEAARATRAEEREQARRPSWVESRIAECAEQARLGGAVVMKDAGGRTVTGAEALAVRLQPDGEPALRATTVRGAEAFAGRLDDAGIAITRVTAADKLALDALRQDEEITRAAAETNRETYQAHNFAELEEGELAAVTRNGDVYRINPAKIGDAVRYLPENLPGVAEVRAGFETDREQAGALWAERQAAADADRETFNAERDARRSDAAAEQELDAMFDVAGDAFDSGSRATGKFFGGLGKIVESILGGMLGFLVGEPKLTREEVRAAEDRAEADADAAAAAEKEAAIHDQIFMMDRQKALEENSFEARFGKPPTREAYPERERDDDYGRDRER